jgi:hypothetical protein
MSTRGVVGDVTREYCQKFPTASSLQLARILRRDEPKLFASVEVARSAVRYYRGTCGPRNRGQVEHTGAGVPRLNIPESDDVEYREVPLPTAAKRWLVIGDLHVPFQDRSAVEAAIDHGRKKKCDGLLILGDFCDFYRMSWFRKDPRKRDFGSEVERCGLVLREVRNALKPKAIVWKLGNHEERFENYLIDRAPELLSVPTFSFQQMLDTDAENITFVPAKAGIRHGKLLIVHGHETRAGLSVVSPARGQFLKTGVCTLSAHSHQTSQQPFKDAFGTYRTCWSIGCLCNMHPDYAPFNNWTHGCAVLDTVPDWRIDNRQIIDGKVV